MEKDNYLRFLNFSSMVIPSFWHKLCQLKLEEDKLDEKEREIRGFYLLPDICSLIMDCTSFNQEFEFKLGKTKYTNVKHLCDKLCKYNNPLLSAGGYLINLNSASKFKEYNKNLLIEKYGMKIREAIENGKALDDPRLLNKFILLTFVDLKKYEFIYWFGFPALSSLTFKLLSNPTLLTNTFTGKQIDGLLKSHENLPEECKVCFGAIAENGSLKCVTLKKYIEIRNRSNCESYLCFLDPSSAEEYPGWPLRNIFMLVSYYSKEAGPLKVICLRVGEPFKSSIVLNGLVEGDLKDDKWVGWEKNKRDKFGPRLVNLQNDMDPVRIADSSAELNLKLMKWRLVPDLDLDIIKSKKCLLLGAGTLGCSVARCLMGWGVRHITFVDSGHVSFSNPVRQSLYTHTDCDLGRGAKQKASTAAEALKCILPTMEASGINLDIPMPGHITASIENANKLYDLIEAHDVIFLLTDSRESRWLPTVISSVLRKITITAALGYDTYLVMRHGIESKDSNKKLGCYFCNDVTAPGNSLEDKTLDQQCTVTRPGVSSIAAALAVELMVSILQHPDKGKAASSEETVLGSLPHSLRGFLSEFRHILPATMSFSCCIACSPIIEKSYNENRHSFLENVFESTKYLEDITGLTELHKTTESIEVLEFSDIESDEENN